jgi:Tripartite tricarboxylate transporter family receptor
MRSRSFKAQSGMGGKGNNGFHAILEVPKGDKHPHPRFAQLPEIESFAKTEKEKKLLAMWRGFRTAASPFVLPPGTPKDRVEILQEAMRKAFNDPEFRAEFKKLVSDDVSPLMPEELMKVIKETPRDAEVIEMLKRFSGGGAASATLRKPERKDSPQIFAAWLRRSYQHPAEDEG